MVTGWDAGARWCASASRVSGRIVRAGTGDG
jgi:hypothetical protein